MIGGTGLIGTGITRGLVADGHDVTRLRRGETDADAPSTVSFRSVDRADPAALTDAIADGASGCVIDMACSDAETARDAVAAFADRTDQYVFCSTVDVYHRPPERNPVREGASRKPPVSECVAGKAAAEGAFRAAHGDAFATTIVRPWSTYGEGEPVSHTLGTGTYYVDRVCKGKPILVHGDGTSLWGPCHRDDVARAFAVAVGNPDAFGEAYHVTSEETMT